ncbi:sigma-70 family RNA polymerase sigma factor [Fodinicola acaciae]|uniref:sigma-70 family RNA polymerase sigma factor n=1 Tax=Fodinicola acaciae TaxID=2681555 RepID=UPI0013D765CC|nr:sigma-70 family RNA polymerase sigma factor [Fodinicola acaciae]
MDPERFEEHRDRLRAIAFRMLGSSAEADDAVQETWLRLARTDDIANLGGWLTTVVSRICLDMLRSRAARREELAGDDLPDQPQPDPAEDAVRADEVGRAVLVVLDRLTAAERIAFVLHDMFAVPFDQIAPIVDRTTVAAKKLASRARQKVRGTPVVSGAELARQRHIVATFLAAVRAGDLDAILAVLDPEVVRRADLPGRPAELRGARRVTEEIATFGRAARFADLVLLDGHVGIVVAPGGRPRLAIAVTISGELISGYRLVTDPAGLANLELAVLQPSDPHARVMAENPEEP